jgi:hypothetical protein
LPIADLYTKGRLFSPTAPAVGEVENDVSRRVKVVITRVLLVLFPCALLGPHVIPWTTEPPPGPPARTLHEVTDTGDALPSNEEMEQLAATDAIAFLENCIRRYDRRIAPRGLIGLAAARAGRPRTTGYTCVLQKQERIRDRLEKKEIIKVAFRDQPHSVFMDWVEGWRLARRALYVAGENKEPKTGKSEIIIKSSFGLVVRRDPEGEDARRSGRYTLPEFGIKKGMQRALVSLEEARKENILFMEYLGKEKVKEAGDRECWKIRRSRYPKPEGDGVTEMTLFIDVETWLQVGTILKGVDPDGKPRLIAEYWFRDIRLDPVFDRDQFTEKAIRK